MPSSLFVAAGGGGDAIAAAVLADRAAPGEVPAIATYAWDRLIIDPLPGPRGVRDFDSLIEHAPHAWEITYHTTPRPPAGSTLPRLARDLPARLFLLDPHSGAVGMAHQLRSIARFVDASSLVLVDVGGDLVATGDEPELRSPLADALALTACELTGLPYQAVVAGPGVDGELSEQQVIARCQALGGTDLPALSHVEASRSAEIFNWHPSEATGLWTAAAKGHRGRVEARDAGLPVTLTDASADVYSVPVEGLVNNNVFAAALMPTRSLGEVEEVVGARRGETELDYERRKASRVGRPTGMPSMSGISERIEKASTEAGERADYLTVRRLSELVRFPPQQFERLARLLSGLDARRLNVPLWRVR